MTDQYDGMERRKIDPIQQQIDDLIMQATEPKDKALLLIFNKFALNLEANTELTRTLSGELKSHTERFEIHEKKELAMFNQGRGFIYATLLLLSVIQGMFLWAAKQHLDETEELKQQVLNLRVSMAEHKEHHKQEEKYREGPKVDL